MKHYIFVVSDEEMESAKHNNETFPNNQPQHRTVCETVFVYSIDPPMVVRYIGVTDKKSLIEITWHKKYTDSRCMRLTNSVKNHRNRNDWSE